MQASAHHLLAVNQGMPVLLVEVLDQRRELEEQVVDQVLRGGRRVVLHRPDEREQEPGSWSCPHQPPNPASALVGQLVAFLRRLDQLLQPAQHRRGCGYGVKYASASRKTRAM